MGVDHVVSIFSLIMMEVAILVAPILLMVIVISFVISILQVLTSLQDQTLTAVPRLLATGLTLFFLMPWMWRHLALYTVGLFSDFRGVLQ